MAKTAIKKLPELDPINYVDVVNPQMLKKWLSNSTAAKKWDDAVWDISNDEDANQLAVLSDLAKKPQTYTKADPLLLGTAIKNYVDDALSSWTDDANNETARALVASLPLFVEMSKTLPHVNPSDEYKYAYRGTSISEKQLRQFIENNSNPKDWVKTKVGDTPHLAYRGPKSKLLTYKPHRSAQSWTVSYKSATRFGNVVIATPLDNSFFFDPVFMNQYGYAQENETIHFGKEPMKVVLLIDEKEYKDITLNKSREEEDEEMKSVMEFYDGNKLAYEIDKLMKKKKGKFFWWDNGGKKSWEAMEKSEGLLNTVKHHQKLRDNLKKLPDQVSEGVMQESMQVDDEEGTLTLPL
jgi:hypothetical protein